MKKFKYVGSLWKPKDSNKLKFLLLDEDGNMHKVKNYLLSTKIKNKEIEIDGLYINHKNRLDFITRNDDMRRIVDNYHRACKMYNVDCPFEFSFDKGRIFLKKFHQLPGLTTVVIPHFVTGFERDNIFEEATELENVKFTSYIYGNIDFAFSNTSMKKLNLINFDMRYVTSASNVFSNNKYLEKITFELETSAPNLEIMDHAFANNPNLQSVNIENISDLLSLTDIYEMFNNCPKLQSLQLDNINNAPNIHKFGL